MTAELRDSSSVHTWLAGLREQSHADPEGDAARLEALQRFCAFVGKDPDTIVRECLRESETGTKISIKGRRLYATKIEEFAQQGGSDARTRATLGSTIRSFLIHNGIFLQSAPVLR
jgi:hypothetical protein